MTEDYEDFDGDSNEENDEDDEIGALGSILSWDEDDDGGVGGTGSNSALSDRETAMVAPTRLPDLVSFKDGGLTTSYLQQLASVPVMQQTTGNDASPNATLNLPLPTPITYAQLSGSDVQTPLHHQLKQHQQPNQQTKQQHQSQQHQQQESIPTKHQQVAATATAPNNQVQPQLLQMQQQQQMQLISAQANAQQSQQAQQQQQASSSNSGSAQQAHQVPQQSAVNSNLTQQGAFALFQQNALIAQAQQAQAQAQGNKQQQINMGPGVAQLVIQNVGQPGQDQRADQQHGTAAPQFAFADPRTFLRQLQVAQLQQQFNAVQQVQHAQAQGRSLSQPVMTSAPQATPVPAAMPQQMQFQPQVPMVASVSVAQAPQRPPTQKKASSSKKQPQLQTDAPSKAKSATARKTPVVSASDTDGELSSKLESSTSSVKLLSTKSSSSALGAMRKSVEIDISHMSAEEKAKANRDRNREHARNTRLRKKAYLEKLKTTVDELCRERDTLVSERAGAANILVEMHNTRTEVLMSFFALRSANEKRRELWASILDDSCFACVMPVTPYRSFPASEVQVSKCQRTILGIDGMMADTASLHVLLNSLVDRSRFPNGTIVFRYTLVTEEAVIAGNQIMARWVMSTLNATQCGARMEVAKQGMLCCKFNSAHKIIGLELMFDVMALMLQLKQAAGSETFSVIPNTVQTCQRSFDKPMVMTLADEPYTIVQVNKLWEEMTGYKAEEVVGKTSCRVLEGEETDLTAVEVLMNEIRFKRPASAMIVNCKKSGGRFRNFFLAYPLSTDSRITHYLYLSTHVDPVMGHNGSSSQVQQGMLYTPKADAPAVNNGMLMIPTASRSHPGQLQANQHFLGFQNGKMPSNVGQPSPAITQAVTLPLPGIQNVLSSPIAADPAQSSMLPPALAVPNGNGIQQVNSGALKRLNSGDDNGNAKKHPKSANAANKSKADSQPSK